MMHRLIDLFVPQGTPERAGALITGFLGFLTPLLGAHGPELVVWILIVMGVDLMTGLTRALVLPKEIEQVDGGKFARGVLKKFAILTLLVVAAMLDRVMHLSELIADSAGPVAFSTMVGILMYEGASIVKNVQATVGRTAFIVGLLRLVDEFRTFPRPKPDRRYYDPDPDNEDDL